MLRAFRRVPIGVFDALSVDHCPVCHDPVAVSVKVDCPVLATVPSALVVIALDQQVQTFMKRA
jgi:hypothetical protein